MRLMFIALFLILWILPGIAATSFLPELERGYFTAAEIEILDKTVPFLGLEYGLDRKLRVYYIDYSELYSEGALPAKRAEIAPVLTGKDVKLVKSLYVKLYKAYHQLITEAIIIKDADQGTYERVIKSRVPAMTVYLEILGSVIVAKDPRQASGLQDLRRKIEFSINRFYEKVDELGHGFLTKGDVALLEQTTQALDFDYGYDRQVDLVYIFSFSHSAANFPKKEKDFAALVQKLDMDRAREFYVLMYKIYRMTETRIDLYRKKKDWKNFTYLTKDLLPPLKQYFELLEKNILVKNAAIPVAVLKEKKKIDSWVKWYYTNKDNAIESFGTF